MGISPPLTSWTNTKILFVMATKAEFGPALQRTGIQPFITGVGLINAATELTAALITLQTRQALPDLVINLGTAGAQDLPINEIYEVSHIRNTDMNVGALGFAPGQTPLSDQPIVADIPLRFGLPAAPCYSTTRYDELIPNKGHTHELEDMEFAAIAHVCRKFGVACSGLKGVSNNRDTVHTTLQNWEDYCAIIDRKFAAVIERIKAAF